MKKIQKSKSSPQRKIIIILVAIILVALGSAAVYARYNSSQDSNNPSNDGTTTNETNLDPATDEQKQAGDEQKQNSADSETNEEENTDTLSVTITAFNQNGTQVQIRSLINEVSSAGSCVLTLENNKGIVITKTSDIQAQPSSSSCKGFDLTTDEVTPGTWKATISVTIGSQTGNANKTLTIQ